jgi:hypothetical protein
MSEQRKARYQTLPSNRLSVDARVLFPTGNNADRAIAKTTDCGRSRFFQQVLLPDQSPIYAHTHYMAC